jgi:hypothetical protein
VRGLLVVLLAVQAGGPDPARVDAALRRASAWLRTRAGDELTLLALFHAGVPATDPAFRVPFEAMLRKPLQGTYQVALQAMLLEDVDRVRYQGRIVECAQFLVDHQARNGQWSYAREAAKPSDGTPTLEPPRAERFDPDKVVIFEPPAPNRKPPVLRKVPIRKRGEGPAGGDNSNSQYALLGLRACHDAGVVLPTEVLESAARWWRESQTPDQVPAPGDVPTGIAPAGWGYHGRGEGPYGSMTAGAVGALVICDHILGSDWKRDEAVKRGVEWLARRFSVTENPGRGRAHHHYYLYALERAGVLYGTERFGKRDWYAEGARLLLEQQAADGSWNSVHDTSFAILFLKKATAPLVESTHEKR